MHADQPSSIDLRSTARAGASHKNHPYESLDRQSERSTVVGRGVRIGGRHTNVSLEDAFWGALLEIAATRGVKLGDLVETIERRRRFKNLSSAIRVFVLEHYIAQRPRGRLSAKQRHKNTKRRASEPSGPASAAPPKLGGDAF
jgi:predicted DNA-binding ribbon-helix-helix protein